MQLGAGINIEVSGIVRMYADGAVEHARVLCSQRSSLVACCYRGAGQHHLDDTGVQRGTQHGITVMVEAVVAEVEADPSAAGLPSQQDGGGNAKGRKIPLEPAYSEDDEELAGMSEDERALMRLRLDGREWDEVAAMLGISSDAARQRWTTLRKRMREFAATTAGR